MDNHLQDKKTLIVTYDYKPSVGGMGIYSRLLHDNLLESKVLTANGNSKNGDYILSTGPVNILSHLVFSFRLFFSLDKYIRKSRADIVHIQSGPGGVFLFRKPKGVKVVATTHHSFSLSLKYKKDWRMKLYYLIMLRFERITLKQCDEIISVSNFLKSYLLKKVVDTSTMINVLHIPPADYFGPMDIKKENMILYVGRLEKQKGIQQLLEGFTMAEVEARMVIIGQGNMWNEIEYYISHHHLEKRIKLIAWLPHRELVRYYNRARICIMPSTFEALGQVALESLACGTPCIVGENTGVAELIVTENPDLLLPSIDAQSIRQSIEHNYTKIHQPTDLHLSWASHILRVKEFY